MNVVTYVYGSVLSGAGRFDIEDVFIDQGLSVQNNAGALSSGADQPSQAEHLLLLRHHSVVLELPIHLEPSPSEVVWIYC